MESRNEFSKYLENITLLLTGVLLLAFPLVFNSLTTDPYALPKQVFLIAVASIGILLIGIRMISDGSLRLRRTPFDLPVAIFGIVAVISAAISVNRMEAIIAVIPLIFAIIMYFVIVNTVRSESAVLYLLVSLVIGGSAVAVLSVLSLLNIYVLPFEFTQNQLFTPLGTLLDEAIYLAFVLPMAASIVWPVIRSKKAKEMGGKEIGFAIATIIITIGLGVTMYKMVAIQRPIILPFETGFQTAMASVSQDSGRVAQSFLLGSGFGTYSTVFTRFKQAAFNLNPTLWSYTFFRSSSFVLELLATMGVLGLASYLFLTFKVIKHSHEARHAGRNFIYFGIVLATIAAFVLPFSFTIFATFFIILALFASVQGLFNKDLYYDVKMELVAFKEKLISIVPDGNHRRNSEKSRILPAIITGAIVIFLLVVVLGVASRIGIPGVAQYVMSDVTFQKSLVAAGQNNGGATYDLQNQAITEFPYRDAYYRIFSQTNLALANSLAAQQPQGASPSAQVQQTIFTLIQQAINSARTSTAISPLTSLNWQNLSNIYRSLIGFGQNAENFAILANQQANLLDPNNPQGYINLGGIYYQMEQWDPAQREFLIAIQLKPDLANAYYNLGHALENKGDLQNALAQYQTVRALVQADSESVKVINEEITALEAKIGEQANSAQTNQPAGTGDQAPLEINSPEAQLPSQNPPVEIPAPENVSPTPTPRTGTATPTPVEEE